MCGISGYYGQKKLDKKIIINLLKNMSIRGPDTQKLKKKKFLFNNYLFHSRLSIIDLNNRSDQPMIGRKYSITFNGEIYNYLELKTKLKKLNIKFKTNSDTEVLLKGLEKFGLKFLKKIEGMWALSILNNITGEMYLSRDKFGEKPLFYHKDKNNFYFGSQIEYIKILINKNITINNDKLLRFISCGYKSIFKKNDTYFNKIKSLEPGYILEISPRLNIKKKRYLKLNKNFKNEINQDKIISNIKDKLINSIKIRTRSDVPIGFCLSGGIDSGSLVSIAKKTLNLNFNTYSVINENKNYNEINEIDYIVKHLKINNKKIFFNKKNFLNELRKLIKFRKAPVATISYYVHSQISKFARKDGVKVLFSGTGADEIFTGYYDHYLIDIIGQKKLSLKVQKIKNWKRYVHPNTRNPIFQNLNLFKKNFKNLSFVYDNEKFLDQFIHKKNFLFEQKKYHSNILKNRMLNELFHESVPVMLFEDDQNSMINGIENRSPFLDTDLMNYSLKIPSKLFIQNGYNKYLLREALKDILPDKIRLNRKKIGFNFDLNSLIDLKNSKTQNWLLEKKSKIFNFINYERFSDLITKKSIDENFLQKFIFTVISSKIFLEENN
jgi:asparagine synthase (glutamine-hydrolysing)